ncbi:MAG: hypothetical protein H7A21_02715 [Spirochaetales bacterium]|nr:hypothetical protein [Leptospiraceae bacterium]MCP5480322.1 hypothetical protein [Spirochaetales bacterium]
MTFFLIAISFLGSVALTLLLRRLDRGMWRSAQLKRVGETREQQLEAVANRHLQSIKDAVLDFEMLVRQSRDVHVALQSSLEGYQDRLETIREDRTIADRIQEDLGRLAGSASSVSAQVEKLDRGLERLGQAESSIYELHHRVEELDHVLSDRSAEAEATLGDVVARLIRETEERTRQFTENVRSGFQLLQEEMRQLEQRLDDQTQDVDTITERVSNVATRLEDRWMENTTQFDERFKETERRVAERIGALESGLGSIRSKAVESMQSDIARIRGEMEDFNLATISRRDEIMNETRRMGEHLQDEMKSFRENYLAAENKLIKDGERYKEEMKAQLLEMENEWRARDQERVEELKKRVQGLEQSIESARKQELDVLGTEAGRLREEIRSFGQELTTRLDEQLVGAQEAVRQTVREEERNLVATREELSQIKEHLNYLGQELKAAIRAETEHGVTLVREARRNEEEELASARQDLEEIREAVEGGMERVQEHLREAGKLEARMNKACETGRQELIESADTATRNFTKKAENFLQEQREALEELRDRFEADMDSRVETIEERLAKAGGKLDQNMEELASSRRALEEDLRRMRGSLREDADGLLREITDNISGESERIEETAERARGELEERAREFFADQDDKLGRLSETIDEKISKQLILLADRGQLQIEELEKRTGGTIREAAHRLEQSLESAKVEFKSLRDEIGLEVDQTRRLKDDILEEIDQDRKRLMTFREEMEVINRADEYVHKLDTTVEVLTDRLALAREENARLDEYVRNFELARQSRKELESELRLLETQRSRLKETEDHFHSIEARVDELNERFNVVGEAEELARNIEKRIKQFQDFKDSFEKYFGELGERRKFVEGAIRHVEKVRDEAKTAHETTDKLLDAVERAGLRQEHIGTFLKDLESRASLLGRLEKDFVQVEARFEQMDGLMLDLEERQRQIASMSRKVEDIRLQNEHVREELASLVSEADEKMDRLTAFYETLDSFLDEGPRIGSTEDIKAEKLVVAGARAGANGGRLPDHKRNGILSLYLNHKWEPDLIAERMKVDPAIVRAVIASHNK